MSSKQPGPNDLVQYRRNTYDRAIPLPRKVAKHLSANPDDTPEFKLGLVLLSEIAVQLHRAGAEPTRGAIEAELTKIFDDASYVAKYHLDPAIFTGMGKQKLGLELSGIYHLLARSSR